MVVDVGVPAVKMLVWIFDLTNLVAGSVKVAEFPQGNALLVRVSGNWELTR